MLIYKDINIIINKYLEKWKAEIIKNHESAGQKATGDTEKSLHVKMREDGGSLLGASYIYVLEKGRGKSNRSQGGVVKDKIRRWIQAKGITGRDGISLDSLVYLITRKIHEEGTILNQKGGRTDIYSNVITKEAIDKLVKEISTILVKNIKSDLINI